MPLLPRVSYRFAIIAYSPYKELGDKLLLVLKGDNLLLLQLHLILIADSISNSLYLASDLIIN
jgi:hypothetical protein